MARARHCSLGPFLPALAIQVALVKAAGTTCFLPILATQTGLAQPQVEMRADTLQDGEDTCPKRAAWWRPPAVAVLPPLACHPVLTTVASERSTLLARIGGGEHNA